MPCIQLNLSNQQMSQNVPGTAHCLLTMSSKIEIPIARPLPALVTQRSHNIAGKETLYNASVWLFTLNQTEPLKPAQCLFVHGELVSRNRRCGRAPASILQTKYYTNTQSVPTLLSLTARLNYSFKNKSIASVQSEKKWEAVQGIEVNDKP